MNLHRLPGNRGTFPAKTAKKTRMFCYQVTGSEADIQQYMLAKEAEGYAATIDPEYGPLFFTSWNLGVQASLDVIVGRDDGRLIISAYNTKLREADEMKGVLSEGAIDKLKLDALTVGTYARKVSVTVTDNQGE
jgi:hypothetical protein